VEHERPHNRYGDRMHKKPDSPEGLWEPPPMKGRAFQTVTTAESSKKEVEQKGDLRSREGSGSTLMKKGSTKRRGDGELEREGVTAKEGNKLAKQQWKKEKGERVTGEKEKNHALRNLLNPSTSKGGKEEGWSAPGKDGNAGEGLLCQRKGNHLTARKMLPCGRDRKTTQCGRLRGQSQHKPKGKSNINASRRTQKERRRNLRRGGTALGRKTKLLTREFVMQKKGNPQGSRTKGGHRAERYCLPSGQGREYGRGIERTRIRRKGEEKIKTMRYLAIEQRETNAPKEARKPGSTSRG